MLAELLLVAELWTASHACAASTDVLVKHVVVAPTVAAVQKAARRWSRWIDKQETDHCFTLLLWPAAGTDGGAILAPSILVFRKAPDSKASTSSPKGRMA